MTKRPAITTIKPDKLWQVTLKFPPIIGVPTNCWFWKSDNGLTLIDSGCPGDAEILMTLAREFGELKQIIITHAHPDHAGAAGEISRTLNVPVLAHENELDYLRGKQFYETEGSAICRCIMRIAEFAGVTVPKIENLQAVRNNDKIAGLEILHTPGHTPGSISLFEPETKSLFCGDNYETVSGKPLLGKSWFTLDKKLRNQNLEKYNALDASMLLTGHGRPYESSDLAGVLKRLVR